MDAISDILLFQTLVHSFVSKAHYLYLLRLFVLWKLLRSEFGQFLHKVLAYHMYHFATLNNVSIRLYSTCVSNKKQNLFSSFSLLPKYVCTSPATMDDYLKDPFQFPPVS